MQVLEDSDRRIVIKDSNWGGLIVGIVLLLGSFYFTYVVNPLAPGFDIKSLIIPGILFLIGALLFFTSNSTMSAFDKDGNVISFVKKSVLGARNVTYQLDQVARLEMREQVVVTNSQPRTQGITIGGGSMGTPHLQYQLVMVMKDGAEVPLDHLKSSGTSSFGGVAIMGGTGTEKVIGQKIATFLGIPYQEISPMGANQIPPDYPPAGIPPLT